MATLFIRAHTYTADKAGGILDEADRQPDACTHVDQPQRPKWLGGNAATVRQKIADYMATRESLTLKNGQEATRKRRHDARCLVAGVFSYPVPVSGMGAFAANPVEMKRFIDWSRQSQDFIKREFGKDTVFCVHLDESHPHIHFFAVGNANKIHHGLKAEFDDTGKRRAAADRSEAHKAGLRGLLNDYWLTVGQNLGFNREEGVRPIWRVKDRQIRAKIADIDKALTRQPDESTKQKRDELWEKSPKAKRPSLSF